MTYTPRAPKTPLGCNQDHCPIAPPQSLANWKGPIEVIPPVKRARKPRVTGVSGKPMVNLRPHDEEFTDSMVIGITRR